jgi:asparagine synthetase A
LIHEISNELSEKYQIENIYPKNIEFVEAQLLENEFSNLSSYDKEAEIAQELNAFILMQPGKQLLSGITHAKRNNLTYDNNNYNEIHLLDENDGTSINVASIAYKLYGNNLEKNVKQKTDIRVEENKILNEFIKNKTIETIEIKINLFKLYLILLKKGHIAEVQPKVLSKVVVQLKNKHMIEPI